jgi:RNA polymerase sigma factor (sigma-70 family)
MTVAPAPSDAALVARLRSRDRTAWEDVYRLYADRLYKFAYHLTGNPHDAADLVQETFVRALPRVDSLDPAQLDLGAYLFATERNLFLKSVERARRQQPVEEVPEPSGPGPIEDDPQRSTLLGDQQERVRRANAALPPRQRLVLALRELEDRSYAEIGELVGLNENAVAQLISRARQRLREELRLVQVDRSKLPEECQALLPLLSSYLDGQLKGAAAEPTIDHLESCELCQAALADMREASRLYRALLPFPFTELFDRIDGALAASGFWSKPPTGVRRVLPRRRRTRIAAGAVTGAVAVALLVTAGLVGRTSEPAVAEARADTTPPRLVLPERALRREAASAAGARVAFAIGAQDGVDGAVAASCAPSAGALFPIGATEVACTATDTAGNEVEGSFQVEVADSTAPALTAPELLEIEAEGPAGAEVSYSVRARDRVDAAVAVRCAPRAGEVFPIGESTVQCTARDGAGNVTRASFTVAVGDSKAPLLELPEAVAVEVGERVEYEAAANDAVDGPLPLACTIPTGRTLPVGATTVVCTTEDRHGNKASGSFVVRVGDTSAPVLRLPRDRSVEAEGPRGTRVVFAASARDRSGGDVPVRCSPAPRSRFPLGATIVRCSAADAQGNTARGTFVVTVVDTTAPRLALPSALTVEATGARGAAVDFQATAKDSVDGSVVASCSPSSGAAFPLGPTAVRCSARDASGNRVTGSFRVTVVDTTAPVLTLPADRTVRATSPRGAAVTYTATAADAVDGPVTVGCTPASGSVFPVGSATVTCAARDSRGNEATGRFTVTVTPFPQPDLVVSAVSGTSITIANRGNAAAGPFFVTVQGGTTFAIRALAAGATVTRTLTCASIPRLVTVDAQNQVAESNESNNTAQVPAC